MAQDCGGFSVTVGAGRVGFRRGFARDGGAARAGRVGTKRFAGAASGAHHSLKRRVETFLADAGPDPKLNGIGRDAQAREIEHLAERERDLLRHGALGLLSTCSKALGRGAKRFRPLRLGARFTDRWLRSATSLRTRWLARFTGARALNTPRVLD